MTIRDPNNIALRKLLLAALLAAAAALAASLPGITSLPVTDRDEARFVQASRQMMETGDYVRIMLQDKPRHKKPAGAYWLQSASVKLLSPHNLNAIWAYRVPSTISVCLAVLLLFWFSTSFFGSHAGLAGALILGTSLIVAVEARLAKADAPLLACVMMAQAVIGLAYVRSCRSPETRNPVSTWPLFWLACAAGTLIKGPVLPAVVTLTILALAVADRKLAWLRLIRPYWGACLYTGAVFPWLIAVQRATGGAFLRDGFFGDILPKLLRVQESHGGFPGYYCLTSFAAFWPWSLFSLPALGLLIARRTEPPIRFLLAWLCPAWILLEFVPTKLPHYTLVLYPALAAAIGVLLSMATKPRAQLSLTSGFSKTGCARAVLWLAATLLLAAGSGYAPFFFGIANYAAYAASATALVCCLAACVICWLAKEPLPGVSGAAIVFYCAVFAFLLPNLDQLWLSRKIHESLPALPGGTTVYAAGYTEPSLIFLLAGKIKFISAARAAAVLETKQPVALLVDDKTKYSLAFSKTGAARQPLSVIHGYNYSRNEWKQLSIYAPGNHAASN